MTIQYTSTTDLTLCMNCLDASATWEEQEVLDYCPGSSYYESYTTYKVCSTCGFPQ